MSEIAGIIGLGIMGGAMARNLVAAGWEIHGFDPDAAKAAEAASHGVVIHGNAEELARAVPVILCSLPSPRAAVATAEAIAASGAAPRVVIEASTLTLADKQGFAEILMASGHVPLDCPISGTGAQAERRDIVVYASGDSDAIAGLRPFFAAFTRAMHDVGAYGHGTRMKLVANLLVAVHNVASAEAMVLGMKAGLDPQRIVEVISSGVGTSRIFELRAPMMAVDHYLPATMKLDVWQKDMDVIAAFAEELGVATPTFTATQDVYAAARAQGLGLEDTAAVCTVLGRQSKLSRV